MVVRLLAEACRCSSAAEHAHKELLCFYFQTPLSAFLWQSAAHSSSLDWFSAYLTVYMIILNNTWLLRSSALPQLRAENEKISTKNVSGFCFNQIMCVLRMDEHFVSEAMYVIANPMVSK